MSKGRMEAFSDGVLAIVITIMVLELHAPAAPELGALVPLRETFLSYVLSFVYLAIYWNNHHHMLQTVERVGGGVLWANMHLLLWLSLVPFVTAWMGKTEFAAMPVALYGTVLLAASIAYYILTRALLATHGRESRFAAALGSDRKGRISVGIYVAAIALAFVSPTLSCALYVLVALIWLVPDRRFARVLPG